MALALPPIFDDVVWAQGLKLAHDAYSEPEHPALQLYSYLVDGDGDGDGDGDEDIHTARFDELVADPKKHWKVLWIKGKYHFSARLKNLVTGELANALVDTRPTMILLDSHGNRLYNQIREYSEANKKALIKAKENRNALLGMRLMDGYVALSVSATIRSKKVALIESSKFEIVVACSVVDCRRHRKNLSLRLMDTDPPVLLTNKLKPLPFTIVNEAWVIQSVLEMFHTQESS